MKNKFGITQITSEVNSHCCLDELVERKLTDLIFEENSEYKDIVIARSVEPLCRSYGYIIDFEDTKIYYSGDTPEIGRYVKQQRSVMDKIYHEVSAKNSNLHTSIEQLCEAISMKERYKVYCMHIDSDETAIKAKEAGFNVVECE